MHLHLFSLLPSLSLPLPTPPSLPPLQKSADVVSNQLQIRSLHSSLWDDETLFWTRHIARNLQRISNRWKMLWSHKRRKVETRKSFTGSNASLLARRILNLPVSVVTTVEASDWSLQVRVESPFLQSKQPVVRGVMAACMGNLQWSPVEGHTSSIRCVLGL